MHRELRQVPAVANHLNAQGVRRIHDGKKWLYASAAAGVVGLTLFFAGYKQLVFSSWQYSYFSQGVVRPGAYQERAENRFFMVAGLFLSALSLFGFIVEWRLRTLNRS